MRVALKLMMAVLALVVGMLAIEARLRTVREAEIFEADMRRNQHVLGLALSAATELIWRSDGPKFAREVLATSREAEDEIDIRMVDVSRGAPDGPAITLPDDQLARLRRGEEVVQMAADSNPRTLYTYVPLSLPEQAQGGALALELSTSMRGEADFLRASTLRFLAVAAAMAFVTATLAMLLGNRLVGRPVSALVEHARRVGRGDFSHHATIRQRDELGQLGRELDVMADNLADARRRLELETKARVSATDQLRHADRLAAIGTLAAGVAHELGTPLHVVAGRAQLALKHTKSDKVRRDAEVIQEQCARMERIVRELLTFARSNPAQRERHDLDKIVKRAATLVRPLANSHDIELRLPGAGAAAGALVSAEQVEQVLTNLFINAIHAMPDGGELEVRIERGRTPPPGAVEKPTERWVTVVVEDTGTGIAPEDLEKIFDPFFTTKEVGRGVGLGLSVAHGIAREHGGALVASNVEPRGARFELWLPEAT